MRVQISVIMVVFLIRDLAVVLSPLSDTDLKFTRFQIVKKESMVNALFVCLGSCPEVSAAT